VLAFDGPGQGAALREQNLVMRPDWEAVITPVVNYALTRGEIAADKIVLFGYSLAAFLVARAGASSTVSPRSSSMTASATSTRPSPVACRPFSSRGSTSAATTSRSPC
jgi:hypothetical protein